MAITHTPFSLLDQPWLPVRAASGEGFFIHPAEIVEPRKEPIVAFDWSRPDFDAAAAEFMIGLLSMACWRRVSDIEAWTDWWEAPPSPADLDEAFAPFAHAFVLDGDGPRFMQDLEELDGNGIGIDALLIDAPGDNTKKLNKDLFAKRDQVEALSRAAGAMALFTLQAFAPSGGAGHRTSLRGGGPMTAMVVPVSPDPEKPVSLWRRLWLNAWWDESWGDPEAEIDKVLPWCAPTRISEKSRTTTRGDVHPGQVYWGMPRRIRLDLEADDGRSACDLLGIADDRLLHRFIMVKNGHNYDGWSRAHPLTPYYRVKPGAAEWLPSHPQPGHLGYRDWVGLVVADAPDSEQATRLPAGIVQVARDRLQEVGWSARVRLRAAGYDMDNMKARGFVESEMPLLLLPPELQASVDRLTRAMIAGADVAAGLLSQAVGRALASGELPDGKKGFRALARQRFWAETEGGFFKLLDSLSQSVDDAKSGDLDVVLEGLPRAWLSSLKQACLDIFDDLVPLAGIEAGPMERLVRARRWLQSGLQGYGKDGTRLFAALHLPPPDSKKRSKAA